MIIETPHGPGELVKVYVSELNFTMIKVKLPNNRFMTYNVGKFNQKDNVLSNAILKDTDIHKSRFAKLGVRASIVNKHMLSQLKEWRLSGIDCEDCC